MIKKQKVLQVWMHIPATFNRRLVLLNSPQHACSVLFLKQLKTAKSLGVDAIVLPINWRVVAPHGPVDIDNKENWQNYRNVIELCISQGLNVIPEFNFGATGLNDSALLNLLPDWLWGTLIKDLPTSESAESLKYINSYGQDSLVATSLWNDHLVLPYFESFLSAFAEQFSDVACSVPHINIGGGPEGELRYPFLGLYSDGPDFIQLPCFNPAAKADFKEFVAPLKEQDESLYNVLTTDDFFDSQLDYLQKTLSDPKNKKTGELAFGYFSDWYHQSLLNHGQRLLSVADKVFQGQWQESKLGLRLGLRQPEIQSSIEMTGLVSGWSAPLIFDKKEQQKSWENSLSKLTNGPWKNRTQLLLSGLEESSKQNHEALLLAAADLDIPLMTENSRDVTLEHQTQWDKLLNHVMKQGAFSGWCLRDLDLLTEEDDIGCARLRQFGRLKFAQGQYQSGAHKSYRVMAPLHLKVANQKLLLEEENWLGFEEELDELREAGVTAISTDLWWGLIEGRQPGEFDWSYYDRLVEVLATHDMHWVPILSFHQAGGNVNDDFNQTIPLWLWGKLLEHSEIESVRDLQYVSETGDPSMEYVSLWADPYVLPYYLNFVEAFRDHYRHQADLIDEINVSMGPAGELRYPSYNAHDWGDYPNRGTLQCYSPLAQKDWLRYLANKFKTITALNSTFGSLYNSFDEIVMPEADALFENKKYIYSAWARELLIWYNLRLMQHGRTILESVLNLLTDKEYIKVPVGIKIPGIHWEISDPISPRVAEISAGLIAVHPNLSQKNSGEYVALLKGIIPEQFLSRVVVHFTCLEMINKDHEGYSRAEDLVNWMADAAHKLGVELMGENALAGELYGQQGWLQMERAMMRTPGYGGITLLRMQNFFDENKVPMKELKALVNRSI